MRLEFIIEGDDIARWHAGDATVRAQVRDYAKRAFDAFGILTIFRCKNAGMVYTLDPTRAVLAWEQPPIDAAYRTVSPAPRV